MTIKDDLIIYDAVTNHGRNIYYININTLELGEIKSLPWDSRDPHYNNDVFIESNDRFGIFNLFYTTEQQEGFITNVIGGAFMPSLSKDNKIAFSLYENGKYKIGILNDIKILSDDIGYSNKNDRSDFVNLEDILLNTTNDYYANPESNIIDNLNDSQANAYTSKTSGPFFIPRVMYDYNTLKPGLYLFDTEYLNNASVIGAFSMNTKKDIALFLFFDYNEMKTSYFFNFYCVSRHLSRIHPYINHSN